MAQLDLQDRIVGVLDQALRTLLPSGAPGRASPARDVAHAPLGAQERQRSIALMRVNHAGEIAAQALYSGQSLLARSGETRARLEQAAREERDHLLWCAERLTELRGRRSVLDPLWYVGSFGLGVIAGGVGDRFSLGFVAETESQVEAHLEDHLRRLPERDARSRAILARMAEDEAHHGTTARLAGGSELPWVMRSLMRVGGELLRRAAFRL